MSERRVFLSAPHMGGTEMDYVQEAFNSNMIAPLGPHVDRFEATLQEYTGTAHAAALSSGTAALHLALILYGVEQGDEVLVSDLTFSASVNPVVYQGATPVLVDSEAQTWNVSPEHLEKAIQDRINKGKPPKAFIMVHLYGMPALTDALMNVARRYGIPVIEDAAEALGSEYNGKKLGSFGDMGVLSFNGNKIITTSGGGALLSSSEESIQHARKLATQARDPAPHYQHSEIGYNYRLSNILAGIGLGQMEVLPERIRQRRAIFDFYRQRLADLEAVSFVEEPEGGFSNRWLTTILLDPDKTDKSPEDVRLALEERNIQSRPVWKPMHLQPVFQDCPFYGDGTSERLFARGLCLPSWTQMTEAELDETVEVVREVLEG